MACEMVVGGRTSEGMGRQIWNLAENEPLCGPAHELLDQLKEELLLRIFEPLRTQFPNCIVYVTQLYLIPYYRRLYPLKLVFVKLQYGSVSFDRLKGTVMKSLKGVGRDVAKKQQGERLSSHLTGVNDEISGAFSDIGAESMDAAANQPDLALENELEKYEEMSSHAGLKRFEDVVDFWSKTAVVAQFPILSRVALIFFSAPALSGVLERDFGSSGRLITAQRTSLSEAYVEMCMFIHANHDPISLDQVKQLSPDEISSAKPKHVYSPPVVEDSAVVDNDDNDAQGRKRRRD